MTEKEIMQVLEGTGLPARYGFFPRPQETPYIVYHGNGQNIFDADNTVYFKRNTYLIQYYFNEKNPEAESRIENALVAAGLRYEKSEDIWDDAEGVFSIYYYV